MFLNDLQNYGMMSAQKSKSSATGSYRRIFSIAFPFASSSINLSK